MARAITNPTGRIALTPSFPVDVFMKSAPKEMHTEQINQYQPHNNTGELIDLLQKHYSSVRLLQQLCSLVSSHLPTV